MNRQQLALIVGAVLGLFGLGVVGSRMLARKAAEASGPPPTAASFGDEKRMADPIVFLGDSLTAEGPWAALFPNAGKVLSRGIPGDDTAGVLARTLNRRPGRYLTWPGPEWPVWARTTDTSSRPRLVALGRCDSNA